MRYIFRIAFVAVVALLFVGAGNKEVRFTEGIQPGNLAPAINLQGIDLVNSDFVVLQFWAAYDPYSRAENTLMHNAISKLRNEKVKLVSVSLDKNTAVFKGVVKSDRLNETTQFNEPLGEKSDVYRKYRLNKGLGNWLINSEGVIVAKNVSHDEILKLIENN
ncbi:thiol-disulfide isomerase/thioredoxin [Dysgonomonadaceae bacterium PH5-43]|nr:thiol-disulfide isomerase/thioredoxin [Dysgonomonadaceae bacterium PH5-43]